MNDPNDRNVSTDPNGQASLHSSFHRSAFRSSATHPCRGKPAAPPARSPSSMTCDRRGESTGSPQPARRISMPADPPAAVRAPLRVARADCTRARTARRSDGHEAFRCATRGPAAHLAPLPPTQVASQRCALLRTTAALDRRRARRPQRGEPVQSLPDPDVIYTVALRERGDFTDLMGRAAWHQMPAFMLSKSRAARDQVGGLFYCHQSGDHHVALYVHV
jgi:hypothetical protein